jgi:hypothetical protein
LALAAAEGAANSTKQYPLVAPPAALRPELPAPLSDAVMHALERDPAVDDHDDRRAIDDDRRAAVESQSRASARVGRDAIPDTQPPRLPDRRLGHLDGGVNRNEIAHGRLERRLDPHLRTTIVNDG